MQTGDITFKNSQIHYSVSGQGEDVLLCLHGFAESAESFLGLTEMLKQKYTIVLIDMPLHGKTTWNDELLFTVEDLAGIICQISAIGKNNFSLLGYSMGGRIALQLYEYMPQKIDKLILIAPDGMIINPWYLFSTQTKLGNKVFYKVMKAPGIFFNVTTILKRLSLINVGIYKYVHQHLKTSDMRSRLYNIWTTMRKMKPDLSIVKKNIIAYKTPVILIYGRYDKVIRYSTAEKFRIGIEEFCTLRILESGHRLLHEKNIAAIAAEL